MNLTTRINKPEITGSLDWQISQTIDLINDQDEVVAKAEIEIITLNKHRGAKQSYDLLANENEATDWEIPLNLYFKWQNLATNVCESLNITPNIKKAQSHMLIEALSVLPEYRNKGVAKVLLKEIAKHHHKIQSITVLSLPMSLFVDVNECDDSSKEYYQQLELNNDKTTREDVTAFFNHLECLQFNVDESLLAEPLSFDIFISTPDKILAL